jgi:hypothetical protein
MKPYAQNMEVWNEFLVALSTLQSKIRALSPTYKSLKASDALEDNPAAFLLHSSGLWKETSYLDEDEETIYERCSAGEDEEKIYERCSAGGD